LGGHSLLAVRLLTRVEAELGVAISLSAFLEGRATVARMAAAARPREDAGRLGEPAPSPVTTPVLFFVEPGESGMLTLRHFTRALGPAQPVVGLLPERNGARFDQSRSVESLAAGILRTIRETQATGPYYLAGWSIGGLLAYEIATQLRAGGDEVALLALLDAGSPAFSREAMRRGMSLTQRLARQRARGPAGSLRHTRVVATREVRAALVRLHLRPSRIVDDFDWRGAHRVASRYACPGNDAPMDLFLTSRGVTENGSRSLGWEEIHKGLLRIHDVPGGHESMVSEPHVSTVAEMLSVALRRAQEAGGVRA
jgi:thioesterase domain-containing protein